MSKPTHLKPSELGTKEYWDSLYTTEISNHKANPDDIGTVWFDDSDAEAKMLSYLSRLSTSPDSDSDDDDDNDSAQEAATGPERQLMHILNKATTSILDLGCGNGSILHSLRSSSWSGRLMGVDYSANSITLAQQICPEDDIRFAEWDVLNGPLDAVRVGDSGSNNESDEADGWDVVLDKGTFDAISLSKETDDQGRRICEGYKGRVLQLLKRHGLFLITSCNWTEEELRGWFLGSGSATGDATSEGSSGSFEELGRVKYRTFSFGGVKGQTISTICFRKI